MATIKSIGILTSGGDAPGMNAAIRAVTRAGISQGFNMKGIYRGFEGLMNGEIKSFTTENVFCKNIVCNSDLSKLDYLYDYGEYISENECRMAAFVNALPEETIKLMADTFTEGYRKGFAATGKDISIKKSVNIRYFIGFERVVRIAMENFKRIGLDTIINRSQPSFLLREYMMFLRP